MTKKIAQANKLTEYTRGDVSVYHFEELILEYNEKTKEWKGEYLMWDNEDEDWVTDRPVLPGEIPSLLAEYQPITKENIDEYILPET